MNKFKLFLMTLVAATAVSFAQTGDAVASAVATAATNAESTFNAIIGSISPVVFIIVVALVCIGAGIKLFKKGG